MLRTFLFLLLWRVGSDLFEASGWLGRDEAFLASGVISALILFCIPEPGVKRDFKTLLWYLVLMVAGYGIYFKFRSWLGYFIDSRIAGVLSFLLLLIFGAALMLVPAMKRANSPTSSP